MLLSFLQINCTVSNSQVFKDVTSVEIIKTYARANTELLKTDKKAEVDKIVGFITNRNAPLYKCAYHGKIKFFTKDAMVEAEYNHSEECAHVVYMKGTEIVSKKLTKEGVLYLRKLSEAAETSSSISEKEPVIFHYYGEKMPLKYENPQVDSIALKYGFVLKRVAGDDLTNEIVEDVKAHNEKALGEMLVKEGGAWRRKFEAEVGFSLSSYGI